MNTLENYLVTLKIGAWAAIGGLVISLVCLVMLAIIIADLAAIKKALRVSQPAERHPARQAPPRQPR